MWVFHLAQISNYNYFKIGKHSQNKGLLETITVTNLFRVFNEIIAVYFENYTKYNYAV